MIIGALARLAVPGPDPMPIWLTILFGIGGSLLGGLVAQIAFGATASFLLSLVGAVVLIILYRRFLQGRGITGPEGREPPTRGVGVRRRERL